jgi:hypothetical protein
VPIVGLKGSFPLISILYLDPVISVKEVEFAEYLGALELIKEFTNQWNRITILDSNGIETSIIYTKSQSTILLGCKDDCSTRRAHGFPDMTFLQFIVNEFF